nr:hypothetical protein [Micromonospora purpureochromogenes]
MLVEPEIRGGATQQMRQVTDELGRNGVKNVPLFGFDGRTRQN